jgi:predicted transcriptional regulator
MVEVIVSSVTVRVSARSRETLRRLARQSGASLQAVLEGAVEEYETRQFLEAANRSYAALRKNRKAWEQELRERKAWDATLSDGLEED